MIQQIESIMAGGRRTLADASGRIYGVVVGIVTDNRDPDAMGRVKVELPWLPGETVSDWARVAALMAGDDRGSFFLPEVGDEVLVAFEHGDTRRPYVIGALWNGVDKPPETNADGQNNKRVVKSRSGMTILLDDTAGNEHVEIADRLGINKIVVHMAQNKVTISSTGQLELEAPLISIKAQTLALSAGAGLSVEGGGSVDLKGKVVNIKGQPFVNIN
jgi:uncharacterized protein involved in type VI secretion and phage assembly